MYQNQGNNIGNLLRLIQEEKAQNIAAIPPAAQPESPLRGTVADALQTPESPGSEHTISLRPEGVTQQGPTAEPGRVVPAVAPVPPSPVAAAPVAASSPVSQGSQSPSAAAPTQNINKVSYSAPSIGTRITSSPFAVAGAKAVATPTRPTASSSAPQRSTLGGGGALTTGGILSQLPSIGTKLLSGIAKGISTLGGMYIPNLTGAAKATQQGKVRKA